MYRRSAALVAAVIAAFAIAATGSQAATRSVFAGYGGGPGVFSALDTNSFFPSQVVIHAGDSVQWQFRGFHDVAFLGKTKRPGLAVPDAANPVTGPGDAAGAPYWFFGLPRITINPLVAFPAGGKTIPSAALTGSGLPPDDPAAKPTPYKLKFTKPGTYVYYCLVHPGMAARVKVVGKGRKIPSSSAVAAAAKRQLASLVKVAKIRRAAKTIGGATVEAGRATSEYSIESFFPSKLTVKVGAPVTFTMAKDSASEIHTITFGSAAATKPVEDNFVSAVPNAAGPPTLVLDPRATYPTTAPSSTPVAYDSTNHGNGLENLALLDNVAASPNPVSTQVTFKTPGTYRYVCVIHRGMVGEITATS